MRRYRDKLPPLLVRPIWLGGLTLVLGACSPSVNWRVIDLSSAAASVLMPCKPDAAQREVPLQSRPSVMEMRSCETGGVTYAVAWTRLPEPENGTQAVQTWLAASARSAQVAVSPELTTWAPAHARAAWQWRGVGLNLRNEPVDVALAYVLSGATVIQMAVYSPPGTRVDVPVYWGGLSLPRP
jgi:hypothetical protein